MGMDVFGKNPTTETGTYFRASVWWWRPLAEFVTGTYPDLTAPCGHWQTNDGDGLGAEGARALAVALDRDLTSGVVERAAQSWTEYVEGLPLVVCDLCEGTGLRTDGLGVEWGMDVPRDPDTGKGGCNGCAGSGKHPAFVTHYRFDAEIVREFAAFLRDSGGFEIW